MREEIDQFNHNSADLNKKKSKFELDQFKHCKQEKKKLLKGTKNERRKGEGTLFGKVGCESDGGHK